MPRYSRQIIPTDLVSLEIQRQIKSYRPLRLFIGKQKQKGTNENPLNFRAQFNQLSAYKQTRFLQKSVDKYLQLMEEHDINDDVLRECKLFDFLLLKSEQRKYFQSIQAPEKPLKRASAHYSQDEKSDTGADEENDTAWDDLTPTVQKQYRKKNREAKSDYAAQVKNFVVNIPERLKINYLRYAELSSEKKQKPAPPSVNGHEDQPPVGVMRQRRKTLTPLPESLRTDLRHGSKERLTRQQVRTLHQYTPSNLYYEEEVPESEKPTFPHMSTKHAHIRSVFSQVNEVKKMEYIVKSIGKLNEFFKEHPSVVERQIPTLHHLLGKIDDIHLYFTSLGLPSRPPSNRLVFYNHERTQIGSQDSWTDLSQSDKERYRERLVAWKQDYYEKLVEFADETLPNEYMRVEFFRYTKHARKDYEFATKDKAVAKRIRQKQVISHFLHQVSLKKKLDQFHQIEEKLLSTSLTSEQKDLLAQLTDLVNTLIVEQSTNVQEVNPTPEDTDTPVQDDQPVVINLPATNGHSTDEHDHQSFSDSPPASEPDVPTVARRSTRKRPRPKTSPVRSLGNRRRETKHPKMNAFNSF